MNDVHFVLTPHLSVGCSWFTCYLYYIRILMPKHDFHSNHVTCRLAVTRRVYLVVQEMHFLTFSSPVFSKTRVIESLVLCVVLCRSFIVLLLLLFFCCCCCCCLFPIVQCFVIFQLSLYQDLVIGIQIVYGGVGTSN